MFEVIINKINYIFMCYMLIHVCMFFIFTTASAIELNKAKQRRYNNNDIKIKNNKNYIPLSVLIPVYNRQECIVETINSILYSDFPEYEIIIINDGSTDNTENEIINEFNLRLVRRPIRYALNCAKETSIYEGIANGNIKITLVNKVKSGKYDSLNMGINLSKYPLFVPLNANSKLDKFSLSEIVHPFMEDDRVIAVGGNMKVSNDVIMENGLMKNIDAPKKLLVSFQLIEYLRMFLITRVFFNKYNANLILSGAFALFKKEAVLNVGGYNLRGIGGSKELVAKLHCYYRENNIPYKINYAYNAVCWSRVPENFKELMEQRKLWQKKVFISMSKYKSIFSKLNSKLSGIYSYLYFGIFEMLSCIIETIGLISITIAVISNIINVKLFIMYIIIYASYMSVLSIAAIILENYIFKYKLTAKSMIKLSLVSMIESLGYRQVVNIWKIGALLK